MSDDAPLIIAWSHRATFPFFGRHLKQTTPPAVRVTEIAGPVIGNPLRRENTLWLQPSLRGRLCRFFLAYTSGMFLFFMFVCFSLSAVAQDKIWRVAWNARGHCFFFYFKQTGGGGAVLFVTRTKAGHVFIKKLCDLCLAKERGILWKEKSFFLKHLKSHLE